MSINPISSASFEEPYSKVYDLDDYTELRAGAMILGMKLNEMLSQSPTVKTKVTALLTEDIERAENSKLLNQITETNRNLKFDEVAEAIALLNNEIK